MAGHASLELVHSPHRLTLPQIRAGARGVLGVIDGMKSKGIETGSDIAERKQMLRKFGYKL